MGNKYPTKVTVREFENIYKTLYRPLFLYATDFVENEEACRDILADVFTRFWANRDSVVYTNPEAYLRSSVRNACISWLRLRKTEENYVRFISLSREEEEQLDTMDERIDELGKAMDTLPERTRFVLNQCALNEKTYKETADMLGITADGVKKHIVKAYSLIREYFRKHSNE